MGIILAQQRAIQKLLTLLALRAVNQVDRIVARANLPKGIDSTFEREEMLVALDKEGHQLNVAIDPATAHITIPINLSKKVKINVTSKMNHQLMFIH